jgi:hypothetical protein
VIDKNAKGVDKQMSISRIDQPEKHNHGYYVRLTRNGKTKSKFFSDKSSGGKRAALRAAKHHEAELLELAAKKVKTGRAKLSKRNTSGLLGVSRGAWNENGRKAAYWQAAWIDGEGTRKSRKFAVSKYGEEKALRLAKKARREGLRQRSAEG